MYVVADIETCDDSTSGREGELLCGGVYDGETYEVFYDWGYFLDYCKAKKYKRIYAHNGSFDWSNLFEYLIQSDIAWEVVPSGSKIVLMTVFLSADKKQRLTFADSMHILRGSLDSVASKFANKRKIDLGGESTWYLWNTNKARLLDYLYNDVVILWESMVGATSAVNRLFPKINDLGVTVGSLGVKCLSSIADCVSRPYAGSTLDQYCQQAYKGGRVACLKRGKFSGVNVYDFNSLYPYVMTQPLPVSSRYCVTTKIDEYGVYDVEYKQTNTKLPPLLMSGYKCFYEGKGRFTGHELIQFLECGGKVKVLDGIRFLDVEPWTKPFVDLLYNHRISTSNSAEKETCKYLMNSVSGKFCEKTEKQVYSSEADDSIYIAGGWLEKEIKVRHRHSGVGCLITGRARSILMRSVVDVINAGYPVYYVDTDSIHTTATLPNSTKLGDLKLVTTGDGYYVAKKLYAIDDGKFSPRAKGVSTGKNGHTFSPDDYRKMIEGEKIQCYYKQPATFLEVARGVKACRFVERKRKVGIVE